MDSFSHHCSSAVNSSDEFVMLNYHHRQPQNRWTENQQIFICCLGRFFDLTKDEEKTIFNLVFAEAVKQCGFANGLPSTTINTQWSDLRRHRRDPWKYVYEEMAFNTAKKKFQLVIEDIYKAAYLAEIKLIERASDDLKLTGTRAYDHKLRNRKFEDVEVIPMRPLKSLPSGTTPSGEQLSPERDQIEFTQSTSNTKEPVGCLKHHHPELATGQTSPPPLLFRFANDESKGINHRSGYVAGHFITSLGRIGAPEEYSIHEMRHFVQAHSRMHRMFTPFISTSIDPLVAIHRALRDKNNAIVSIIDTSHIDPERIFSARQIKRAYGIYTRGYTGCKEFLIWGFIPAQAIVNTFKVEDLQKLGKDNPDIQSILKLDLIERTRHYWGILSRQLAFDATKLTASAKGELIGRVFKALDLQRYYIDDIAILLNTSWAFVGNDDISDYISGLWVGFGATEPGSMFPMTIPSQEHDDMDVDDDESEALTPCPQTRIVQTQPFLPIPSPASVRLPSAGKKLFKQNSLNIKIFKPTTQTWMPFQSSTAKPEKVQPPSALSQRTFGKEASNRVGQNTVINLIDDEEWTILNSELPALSSATPLTDDEKDWEILDRPPPAPSPAVVASAVSSVSRVGRPFSGNWLAEDRARVDKIINSNWNSIYDELNYWAEKTQ